LRSIQQINLPVSEVPTRRVLGVIRPTTEVIGSYTQTGNVGVLGTTGTVKSESYVIEIAKYWPQLKVYQQACPMWVPLIENNEHSGPGADYFVQLYIEQLLNQNREIDTLLLGCTHYPLLTEKIRQYVPNNMKVIGQGSIVAKSLKDYVERHPEVERKLSKHRSKHFFTTDDPTDFEQHAGIFFGREVHAEFAHLM
jgi:glutamate racemase